MKIQKRKLTKHPEQTDKVGLSNIKKTGKESGDRLVRGRGKAGNYRTD